MFKSITLFKSLPVMLTLLAVSSVGFSQQSDSLHIPGDTVKVVLNKKAKGPKLKGIIIDASTGKPLSALNVRVEGYSAALTDEKGRFSLTVPDYNAIILVSGIGFQEKEISLKGRKELNIRLHEDSFTSFYDEAAFAFSSKRLSHITGAVNTVNTQGGWNLNSETPDTYLQGRVSGLNAIRRSGTAGIGANLLIRGFNSINSTNQPLIVVDGMIYDNNSYGSSLIGGHVNNPLQYIDVKDIDNFTIVKDATASIYGTKAANGIIFINTNHAKELATKIDFSMYGGLNLEPKRLPVMQSDSYRLYLSELLQSGGYTSAQISALPFMNDNPNSNYYTYHNNTNWQKEIFRKSYDQNYFLKITGGDDIAKYALSIGYLKNKGVVDSTDLIKYNTRFNAEFKLTQKLTANANLAFTYAEQNLKDQGLSTKTSPIYSALVKSPFLRANEVDASNNVSPSLSDADIFGVSNPRSLINTAQAVTKNYRFFGSVNFNYQFNKSLNFSSLIGVTYDKQRESYFIPKKGVSNDTLRSAIADSRLSAQVQRIYSLYSDTRISYRKTFDKHNISATAGFRYISSNTESDYARTYNSATDQLISIGNGSAALRELGGEIGKYRWLNNYLTAEYDYNRKYFLNVNVSLDGSSRFGNEATEGFKIGGAPFAVLPSVSASWLVSSEKFMSDAGFIELLKVRASYGLTANDDIGNYTARQYYVKQNLLGLSGLVRGNFGNPELQWERVAKANFGIDASFLNENLSFSVDVYNNRTSKMLIYEPTQTVSGLGFSVTNSGAMRTNGVDVGINARILNRVFKWNTGLIYSTYKNKVLSLPNNNGSLINSYADASYITQVGRVANLFYGYKTNGVYATNAEAASAGYSIKTALGNPVAFSGGDIRFTDVNGDKVIDENDRVVIGNPNPDFTGSFSNQFSYKNWSLDALFTFSYGNDLYNFTRANLESEKNYNNQSIAILNRWKMDGQVTDIPKATLNDPMGNSRFSDRWIEDGSYFRLRMLSLAYNVPLKTKALKYVKVYATGNNLFVLTKYLGYDPEFSATGSIYTQGVDVPVEPQIRSFQLGVRIGL
ncbi:TonB-linked outer membrane protein, SusC/RagA family [Pedobacter sp. ok626]|uniref:SusC/RagA family TonB-linked outer membrane protein n=1 Tax=Pedobacter sp. ok626 TaxID=1761882 RepID=UPI00088C199A|nr:SusC/RagA family TonB-linked outer membrane protein [Pedobacter sp. ok626]SDL41426.1 TonB-linked outer membrane protein, SusC/RagA family [Pedobacter sp. ok626]